MKQGGTKKKESDVGVVERRQRKDGSLPEEIKDDVMVKHRLTKKAAMEFMFQDTVDCSSLRNTLLVS